MNTAGDELNPAVISYRILQNIALHAFKPGIEFDIWWDTYIPFVSAADTYSLEEMKRMAGHVFTVGLRTGHQEAQSLRGYVQHKNSCRSQRDIVYVCTCGLEAAMKATEPLKLTEPPKVTNDKT